MADDKIQAQQERIDLAQAIIDEHDKRTLVVRRVLVEKLTAEQALLIALQSPKP